jgi:thiamine-phosphate pyrophosphorylase
MSRVLKGIYAITDEKLTPLSSVVSQVKRALDNGATIIQFRDKNSSDDEVEAVCVALQRLCKDANATFIIDDRATLVAKIKADGLHIGKDDISLDQARAIVGSDCIIGVSCYGSIHKAKKAYEGGANYVAFGSLFASPTKPHANVIDFDVISQAKKKLNIPVCVIGGIDATNIAQVMPYKPDMYSMVSGVFSDDAIEKNLSDIKNILGEVV